MKRLAFILICLLVASACIGVLVGLTSSHSFDEPWERGYVAGSVALLLFSGIAALLSGLQDD
jgi:hypothetical protein